MKTTLLKKYPPYTGTEPFLYLCFASGDEKAAEPLLARLWKRGCRVWYTVGESRTVAQESAVQERMKNAGLTLVFCSGHFLQSSAKSRMMYLQSRSIPIISVDSFPADNLSAGLREGTPHVKAYAGITDDVEAELIATRGFSQDLIGERPKPGLSGGMKALLGILLGLILAAAAFIGLTLGGVIRPPAPEEAQIPPEEVIVLTLDALPEELSELQAYPNLQKIILPQSEAAKAAELADTYIIVLTGEGD